MGFSSTFQFSSPGDTIVADVVVWSVGIVQLTQLKSEASPLEPVMTVTARFIKPGANSILFLFIT